MPRSTMATLLRALIANWTPDDGHFHVSAVGRPYVCHAPRCIRGGSRRPR